MDFIEEVICEIMVIDGPDGHVDGSEVIAGFIKALLEGKQIEWVKEYVKDKEDLTWLCDFKECNSEENIWWLSFCDTTKPKGAQFQGVIIIKAMGLADATLRTHRLGINPGGEIEAYGLSELPNKVDYNKCGEKLLSKEQLKQFGLF